MSAESGPSDDSLVIWFPCKWCGETLRIVRGRLEVHECSVPHTLDEHLAWANEQIEAIGERQNG